MRIGPQTWGPYIWATIHYVTLGYPPMPTEEQKQKYKQFFESFQYVLPCSICRNHLTDNLKTVPLTDEILSDREKLINWGIDLHNEVNKMNGKRTYSHEEARNIILNNDFGINQYFEMNQKLEKKLNEMEELKINPENKSSNTMVITLILTLCALIFIAIIYKKK